MTQAAIAGLIGLAVGAGAMLLLLPAELFGHVPAVSGTISARPAEVAVVDGETLRLDTALVRLIGVVAPPRGRACRAGGGTVLDCGALAARALSRIISGRELTCRLHERDASGFTQALCDAGGIDVNEALVAGGWARAEPEQAGQPAHLATIEHEARAAQRGLWADGGLSF